MSRTLPHSSYLSVPGLPVVIVLVCFLSSYGYGSSLLDRVVAVVNKDVITWSELYRTMEFEASSEMKALSDADKKRIFKENEVLFLESMIDRRLILQDARRLDIAASREEVTEAMEAIKKKYGMSDGEFIESLRKEGFTLDEYRKRLAEQIILNKVVSQQVRSKIVISPNEVREYADKRSDTEYRIRQIMLRRPEKEFNQEKLEAKAEEIMERLRQGEPFPVAAQKYSDDPSAKAGGDLGLIKREYLSKEFLDVLDRMAVGEVSKPFWTDRGLHVIQLEEKVDALSTAEQREIAQKRLMEKRFNDEYRNWVRSLREKAYVEVRLK